MRMNILGFAVPVMMMVTVLSGCSHHVDKDLIDATDPGATVEWSPPVSNSPGHRYSGWSGPYYALEDHARENIVMARVRVTRVDEFIYTLNRKEYEDRERPRYIKVTGNQVYFPTIRFEFEVLEYLKGGRGADTIWGLVYLFYGEANTRQEASAAYSYYSEQRDTRWDDREAIVFLDGVSPETIPENHYQLGWFEANPDMESYFMHGYGGWYPSASAAGGGASDATGEELRFLSEIPHESQTGSTGAQSPPTINLSEFRRVASMSQSELDNLVQERIEDHTTDTILVRNLTAEATAHSVTLRWTELFYAYEFMTAYRILRKAEGEPDFTVLGDILNVERDGCSFCSAIYEDTQDVVANTTYTYIVRALTNAPNNGTDASVEVSTQSP